MCKYCHHENLHCNKVEKMRIREDLFDILSQFVFSFASEQTFAGKEGGKKQRQTIFTVVSSSLSICMFAIDVDKLPLLVRSQQFTSRPADRQTNKKKMSR